MGSTSIFPLHCDMFHDADSETSPSDINDQQYLSEERGGIHYQPQTQDVIVVIHWTNPGRV